MPIRPSPGAEIRKLIEALGGMDDVQREAAIARLAVIGGRAADRLVRDFPATTEPATRAAMLRALEGTSDPRAVSLARGALAAREPDVVSAALALLRTFAASSADASRDALDALVATALDGNGASPLRIAALEAMHDLPSHLTDPVRRKLEKDSDPEVRARATAAAPVDSNVDLTWRDALTGRLPASPEPLKQAVQALAGDARLTELQRLIDQIRSREGQEGDFRIRREWRVIRGAVHHLLAERGSRLALYDLRDSLLDPDPLPVAFLAAVEEIGDSSCIEPLAAAYEASSRSGDVWWRDHLARAFRAIVHREGLTRRHLVVKRALTRWPDATAELMGRS